MTAFERALNQPEQTKDSLIFSDAGGTVADALNRIRVELLKDKGPGSYYDTWKANIAMSFYDAYYHRFGEHALPGEMFKIHDIANKAAENFLHLLCLQNENNIGLIKQKE